MSEKKIEQLENQLRRYKEWEGADYRLYSVNQEMLEIIKSLEREISKLKRCGCRRLKARVK